MQSAEEGGVRWSRFWEERARDTHWKEAGEVLEALRMAWQGWSCQTPRDRGRLGSRPGQGWMFTTALG